MPVPFCRCAWKWQLFTTNAILSPSSSSPLMGWLFSFYSNNNNTQQQQLSLHPFSSLTLLSPTFFVSFTRFLYMFYFDGGRNCFVDCLFHWWMNGLLGILQNINFMAIFSMTILLFSLNGRCDRHIRVSPHAPDSSQHSCRFYHYHALQSFQILINTFV